ncbi:energy transducer TonB [Loktanella sp. R86503]|uniref:energy transducer TonB family protein n=1 Tax=Loktanella sp. R86503 TaxID=3093847 RepID=UPI0036DC755A
MKRGLEFAGFGLLALGLHVGALAAFQPPPEGGSAASGAGGDALVSLEATSGAVAALVSDWDRPPVALVEPPPDLPQMTEPQPSQPMPSVARVPSAPPSMSSPALQPPAQDNPALPAPPQTPPPEPELEVAEVVPTYAPQMTARPIERPARQSPAPRQAPAQSNPAPSSPAQRAAGQGGGANAGAAQAGQAASQTAAARQSAMAEWGGVIRSRIERRKSYPRAAGRAGGTVRVAIRVGADGGLQGLGIAQSSGNAALDQAALSAVQRAGRFPPAPAAVGGGVHSLTLPMTFSR